MINFDKSVKGLNYYGVRQDGVLIGNVWKSHDYWVAEDMKGQRYIKNTRQDAVEDMLYWLKKGDEE